MLCDSIVVTGSPKGIYVFVKRYIPLSEKVYTYQSKVIYLLIVDMFPMLQTKSEGELSSIEDIGKPPFAFILGYVP